MNSGLQNHYDIIVVGGGHAGIEASLIAAKMGFEVLCITMSKTTIGLMPCNPSIGGIGKGIVVRELDVLGGTMAKVTDQTGIQFRMLNLSKGPAVWSPRAQVDKYHYAKTMQEIMMEQTHLSLLEGMVERLYLQGGVLKGVVLNNDQVIFSSIVILTTGTFLGGKLFIGDKIQDGGRRGEASSVSLAEDIKSLGIRVGRMKTGTSPRIQASSVDYSKVIVQENQDQLFSFSHFTQPFPQSKIHCYITHTNRETHKILEDNMHLSPLYGLNLVQGTGPRYCPSIEDKILRFKDKESHQLFLEPESVSMDSLYINGLSTSMPKDVQMDVLSTIPGLKDAKILHYGYSVEYGYCDPTQLSLSLESKKLKNLFFAGQINGTTGYEEAAGQGIVAGINAALSLQSKSFFRILRDEGYIGIMIDDLISKGVQEPYRLFSSSSEYRLKLRNDNADERLMEKGFELGVISEEDFKIHRHSWQRVNHAHQEMKKIFIKPAYLEELNFEQTIAKKIKIGDSFDKVLVKSGGNQTLFKWLRMELSQEEKFRIFIQAKYEGYLNQQELQLKKLKKLDFMYLSPEIDYTKIPNLTLQAIEKLNEKKPETIALASRLEGISPADIWNLIVYFEKSKI